METVFYICNLMVIILVYFIQYISVYNAIYYCPLSFSQYVLGVHGHRQVSLIC
jgi:hypothetical protein